MMTPTNCLAALFRLELPSAFLLYLGLTLGTLLALWIYHDLRSRRRKIELSEIHLYTCEFCHKRYLDDKMKKVTQCPECDSYNKLSNTSSD